MRYLCLVYHDEAKINALSSNEYGDLVDEVLAYGDELRTSGHYIAATELEPVQMATTIRVRGGMMSITPGPHARTDGSLAGYILIDARDLNDAIRVASRMPPARLGCIEIRPIKDFEPRQMHVNR